jgi:hypothetical protein
LVQPGAEELGLRILGQSRDVACGLELVGGGERTCAELGAQHGVDAVLRVREPEAGTGSYEVVVCDIAGGTEQTRSVSIEHGTGDTLGASAAYEAVALVVRSALIDIAAASAARDAQREEARLAAERVREEQAREAAARAAEEERARAEQDQPRPSDDDPADQSPRLLSLWAGAEFAFIAHETPALGLVGRVTYLLGLIRIGASFTYGFPASLEDDVARIRLQQHTLLLSAAITSSLADDLWIDFGLMPGVAVLSRSTSVQGAHATSAQAETSWLPVLGLETGMHVRLIGAFGLRIHVSLDLVPGAPRFVYDDINADGQRISRTELAPANYVQPRAGIMLFYAF